MSKQYIVKYKGKDKADFRHGQYTGFVSRKTAGLAARKLNEVYPDLHHWVLVLEEGATKT